MADSIRKFMNYLNNPSENGGYWLPNIQRKFVWTEAQIERLFDSILREYPIGTLLFWKTNSEMKYRKFIDIYNEDMNIKNLYMPPNTNQKMLVLDGQQRLQSLYIGLKGSYETKELYFNILSGDAVAPEEIRYEFKFIDKFVEDAEEDKIKTDVSKEDKDKAAAKKLKKLLVKDSKWVKFKEIVDSELEYNQIAKEIIGSFKKSISEKEEADIETNVAKIVRVFTTKDNLVYTLVDSVDKPKLYTEDDVVEIFVRANSAGTPLGKSDLLFSLLTSTWEDADFSMDDLLDELNKVGYEFSRDFVLKTCLVILKKGAAYNVQKLRDVTFRESIIDNWDEISKSIKDVKDYLWSKTYIRTGKAMSSYLALIPIIYFRYHYKDKWKEAKTINDYILRTLLASAFSGSPDTLIDNCVAKIDELKDFDLKEIYGVILDNGRNLEVSRDTILDESYESNTLALLFNIWYKTVDYLPSYNNNRPQEDHIFPQSLLKKEKKINPTTQRLTLQKYNKESRDQIANLMLLKAEENGPSGKTDIPPEEWFKDKEDAYLDLHLIPKDRNLWKLENFEQFIEKRKELIVGKFSELLIKK